MDNCSYQKENITKVAQKNVPSKITQDKKKPFLE
jgi:hypothetical protein